jgi:TPR repeat protein
MNQGSPFMFAWRFDTKTGATEMCTYDPGGWMNTAIKMEMPENLSCHAPPEPFELLKNLGALASERKPELEQSASPFEKAVAAYNREDYAGALQLSRPLAESGSVPAQRLLGYMYQSGIGVLKDYFEAAKWFRAADTGDDIGQYAIGMMHLNGQGVPRDPVSAYMWLDLAAMREHRLAVIERNKLAGSMTAAQVAEAQELARKWRPQRER